MLTRKIAKGLCCITTAIMLVASEPASPLLEPFGIVQEVEAASAKMSKSTVTLKTNENYKLTLKGISAQKQNKVTWKSNNKNLIVTKDSQDGRTAVISAQKPGNYKVTAIYGKKKYTSTVKVLSINKTILSLSKGQKFTLKLSNVNGKITWKASNKNVSIKPSKTTKTAVVTAKKPGKSKISAKANGKTLTCIVNVKSIGNTVISPTATPTETPKPTTAPLPTSTPEPVATPMPLQTATPIPQPTTTPTPKPTIPATGLWLRNTSLYLDYPGPSILENPIVSAKAYPVIEPSNSDERDLKWESYDTSVATVSEDGVITAVNTGTTKVKCYIATKPSIYAECTIEVGAKPVLVDATSIALKPTNNLILTINDTYQIEPTVYPFNATYQSVKWETSNSSVATVDNLGNVTAVGEGRAEITCSLIADPSITATRSVFVSAKTTEPSPKYTFEILSDLDYDTFFKGGELITFNIYTTAPLDKIKISIDNSSFQYTGVFVNENNYDYGYCARRKGTYEISIYIDDELVRNWNVTITSDDENGLKYEAWWNAMIADMGSDWTNADPLHKVINVGQYLLDHYDYDADPNSSYHNDGKGNCNASSAVLVDTALQLGLRAEIVNPKIWAIKNPSHVVAKVWYNDKTYLIEAGYSGKAPRGKVSCWTED